MRDRYRRGTSLVELMIVIGLFGILLYVTFLFVDRGITMYRESVDALEIRQQGILAMTIISDEIRESAQTTVHCELSPVAGVVFTSTKAADGKIETDPISGRVKWNRFVCFYQNTRPDGTKVIERKSEPCAFVKDRDGVTDTFPYMVIPDAYAPPVPPPRDPNYFSTLTTETRLVARHVRLFETKKDADLVEIKIQFNLEGRYTHMVELRTKVFPRL